MCEENMAVQWKKVYVFISSTFKDMHAERDYLVKQVFPQLSEWCEQHRLRLVDIDLRWGVTEEDSQNKNTIKVCLDNIDKCRPFFVCFLGQRRGWVPPKEDFSGETLVDFPTLQTKYSGNTSVTELEVIHALIDPLHRDRPHDPTRTAEYYQPVNFAFFYLRDSEYLSDLQRLSPLQLDAFTNQNIEDDIEMEKWRYVTIPDSQRPYHDYSGRWNPDLTTTELAIPLQCPSTNPASISNWQAQWAKAGINLSGNDLEKDSSLAEKARAYNQKLTKGKLTDFKSQGQSLRETILSDLQNAITQRYPEHFQPQELTTLQKEIDQQEQFLYASSEGFIPRSDDFANLNEYINGPECLPFVLTAPAGMGKSTLLANWINGLYKGDIKKLPGESLHYRFIGQSDLSGTVNSLLASLFQELKVIARKVNGEVSTDPLRLRNDIYRMLEEAGKVGKTIIVLDSLNQLETGLSDLSWLPYILPPNIKLILSFKEGEDAAKNLLQQMQGKVIHVSLAPFSDADRENLVSEYLKQYLKALDHDQVNALIHSEGAERPLFLKIILSELRVFGAFDNLQTKIKYAFGSDPMSAFNGVLERLENDPVDLAVDPKKAVPALFGLLAHARLGLTAEDLTALLVRVLGLKEDEASRRDASECIYLFLRQVRPFMTRRDGGYDFFYESFKLAALSRYSREDIDGSRSDREWHQILAEYLNSLPLKKEIEGTQIINKKKISESIYHNSLAGLSKPLTGLFFDLDFLIENIRLLGSFNILEQFDSLDLPDLNLSQEVREALLELKDMLILSTETLTLDPDQLYYQVIGRLGSSRIPLIQDLVSKVKDSKKDRPRLNISNASFNKPGGFLVRTYRGEFGGERIHPLPDEKLILTFSPKFHFSHTARICNLEKGRIQAKYDQVSDMAVTPDGTRAVLFYAGVNETTARVMDLHDLRETCSMRGRGGALISSEISSDGKTAVSVAHWGSRIKVIDLGERKEKKDFTTSQVGRMVRLPSGRVAILPLSAVGQIYSVGGYSKPIPPIESFSPKDTLPYRMNTLSVQIWDPAQGRRLLEFKVDEGEAPVDFILSRDGRMGASVLPNVVDVWDMETGKSVATIDLPFVKTLAFFNNNRSLIMDQGRTLSICDIGKNGITRKIDCALISNGMQVSPDEKFLARWSETAYEILKLADGQVLCSNKTVDKIRAIRFLPGHHRICLETTSSNGWGGFVTSFRGYDFGDKVDLYSIEKLSFSCPVAVTPDCTRAVIATIVDVTGRPVNSTSDPYSKIVLLDLEHGKELPAFSGKYPREIKHLLINSKCSRIFFNNNNNEVHEWDVSSGNEVACYHLENMSHLNQFFFSSDEKQLVVESDNYLLTQWNLETAEVVREIPVSQIGGSLHADLLLTRDGRKLVTKSEDRLLSIWNLENGVVLFSRRLEDPNNNVTRCCLSSDDRKLALLNRARRFAEVLDMNDYHPIISGNSQVSAFGFDGDSNQVITDGQDQLEIVDIEKGPQPYADFQKGLVFLPDVISGVLEKKITNKSNGQVIVRHGSGETLIWDQQNGKKIKAIKSENGFVKDTAFSFDGKRLFTLSDEALQVWDLERLKDEPGMIDAQQIPVFEKICVSPDGKTVIAGATRQFIQALDVATRQSKWKIPISFEIKSAQMFVDDAKLIVSTGTELTVTDIQDGTQLFKTPNLNGVVISRDGDLGLWIANGELVLADLKPSGTKRVITELGYARLLTGSKISADKSRAVLSYETKVNNVNEFYFTIWDLNTGTLLASEHSAEWNSRVEFVEITDDDRKAIAISRKELRVWDLHSGRQMWSLVLSPMAEEFKASIITTPDEKKVISSPRPENKIWNLETGEPLASVQAGHFLWKFSSGQGGLFSVYNNKGIGANNQFLRVLDSDFNEHVILEDREVSSFSITCTADNRTLFLVGNPGIAQTGGNTDRMIKIWDLQSGKLLTKLILDRGIPCFSVTPDGRILIASDTAGNLQFLNLEGI